MLADHKSHKSDQDAGSERGLKYLKALKHWRAGDLQKAYQEFISVLLTHESDLFAAKRAQLMGLLLGNGGHIYGASLKVSEWAEQSFNSCEG